MPSPTVSGRTRKFGNMPPAVKFTLRKTRNARPHPIRPPASERSIASAATSWSTRPSRNPSVFKTAISVVLSRAAIIMVFTVTRRIAKMIAEPRIESRVLTFPIIWMNPAWKAFSVSVFVGTGLFS
jgi:hypothetical protein